MPRINVPVTVEPGGIGGVGILLAELAADATNFQYTAYTGREIIIAHNSHAATPYTVTITGLADPRNGQTPTITAESIAAAAIRIYGRFSDLGWNHGGQLWFAASNASVLFSVLQLKPISESF